MRARCLFAIVLAAVVAPAFAAVAAQSTPAVASDGNAFLLAWREGSGDDSTLYMERVDRDGKPIGAPAIVNGGRIDSFDVALSGGVYAIALAPLTHGSY